MSSSSVRRSFTPLATDHLLTSGLVYSARELDDYLKSDRHSEQEKSRHLEKARSAESRYLRFLRTKEDSENFVTVKKIGKGAFGEVRLVTRVKDGKIYALKSLNKKEMFKKDQLAHVRAERDILAESDSPWVVKLYTTFQDEIKLYMLMEFLPGGDLMTMLIKYEIFSVPITRFYIAEIILAIEAVHKHGFIHRYVLIWNASANQTLSLDKSLFRTVSARCSLL